MLPPAPLPSPTRLPSGSCRPLHRVMDPPSPLFHTPSMWRLPAVLQAEVLWRLSRLLGRFLRATWGVRGSNAHHASRPLLPGQNRLPGKSIITFLLVVYTKYEYTFMVYLVYYFIVFGLVFCFVFRTQFADISFSVLLYFVVF